MAYSAVFPRPRRRLALLPVVLLLVACLVGGVIAMGVALRGPSASVAGNQKLPGLREKVRTSFGFVTVRSASVSSDQIGDVPVDAIEVAVLVSIDNQARLPLVYSPLDFSLIDNDGHAVALLHPSTVTDPLQPADSASLSLNFISTARVGPFRIRFTDPTSRQQLDVSLATMTCDRETSCPTALP